ncbi:9397_t:CDS:2 [Acaulospora colombiana]|uniref:9397_t:CDS:1 n=1 Tax=Acaulospora colombiana TaxID=27376 RepID=A0ACA9K5B6_9GLOM|nr:9397_t:CDS:2 [Acaulospora colombiana]
MNDSSRLRAFPVARTIDEVLDTAFDLVIICTKSVPEVITTAQLLEPLLSSRYQHPQPTYVFLQNGLAVEKDDRILVGVYRPDGDNTPLTSKEEQDMNRLVRLVKDSGSDAEVATNIAAAKFGKNLWNASFGMVCSLTGLTPQEWNCTKESGETGMQLISECLAEMMVLARALGYGEDLVPSSMPQGIIEQAKTLMVSQSDFVPSALLDVRLGKPIELEVILGEVVRKAKKLDIRMPVRNIISFHCISTQCREQHLEIVYRMLSIVQANLLHKSRAHDVEPFPAIKMKPALGYNGPIELVNGIDTHPHILYSNQPCPSILPGGGVRWDDAMDPVPNIRSPPQGSFSAQNPAQVLIVGFGAGVELILIARVVRSIDEVLDTAFDYVIISTKAVPEIKTAAQLLEPLLSSHYIHPHPAYVFLQNGLEVERDVYLALKERNLTGTLVSAAIYIIANISPNGDIIHDKLQLGVYRPDEVDQAVTSTERQNLEHLVQLIKDCGSPVEEAPNVAAAKFIKDLWRVIFSKDKVLLTKTRTRVAAFDMLSALTSLSPLQWMCTNQSGEIAFGLVNDSLAEMMVLGRALGYGEDLLPSSLPKAVVDQAKGILAAKIDFEPASLVGVRKGRPIELEPVLGELVRKAKRRDVKMPVRS